MNKKDELLYMLTNPNEFLQTNRKSLEQRMEAIQLPKETEEEIRNATAKGALRETGKSVFSILSGGVGDIAVNLLEWSKNINENIEEAKRFYLLGIYFDKIDNHEKALNMLINTMTDPYGNTLVNKVFRLLQDYPNDSELVKYLSAALVHICNTKDFKSLFSFYKFNLSLIERLSPQALTILCDYQKWPLFNLPSMFSNSGIVQGDYEKEFADAYASSKKVIDKKMVERIKYTIVELKKEGHIKAQDIKSNAKLILTESGIELVKFITVNNK